MCGLSSRYAAHGTLVPACKKHLTPGCMHACRQGSLRTLTDGEQLEPQHVVDAHLGDDRGIQVRVLHTQDHTSQGVSGTSRFSICRGQLPGEGSPVSPG